MPGIHKSRMLFCRDEYVGRSDSDHDDNDDRGFYARDYAITPEIPSDGLGVDNPRPETALVRVLRR